VRTYWWKEKLTFHVFRGTGPSRFCPTDPSITQSPPARQWDGGCESACTAIHQIHGFRGRLSSSRRKWHGMQVCQETALSTRPPLPLPRGAARQGGGHVKVNPPQSTRFTDFEADWARAADNCTKCKFVRKQHFHPSPPAARRRAGKGGGVKVPAPQSNRFTDFEADWARYLKSLHTRAGQRKPEGEKQRNRYICMYP